MRNKKHWLCIFFLLVFAYFIAFPLELKYTSSAYPNFRANPHLNDQMRKLMGPHLLPLEHPLKAQLDELFSRARATENRETLLDAGFEIIAAMPGSFVIVARHPSVPGFVFKLYVDAETRCKEGIAHWEWLTRRCIGAKKIRDLIRRKRIKHFVVPDKWLYVLPLEPRSREVNPQPVVVVETDMELVSDAESEAAWKGRITREHLDELYLILRLGYGTVRVAPNIPYTEHGVFAFTDTEYPERNLKLRKVPLYLSPEMQNYWERIR